MDNFERVKPGMRFTRLTVIGRGVGKRHHHDCYICECECGNRTTLTANALLTGNTRSCGCLKRETAAAAGRATATHGATSHPLYHTWKNMLARCYNPANPRYPQYGGRGITVCDRWRNDPRAFFNDIGERPRAWLSLDRIDNDGNYEPQNVRWGTIGEQSYNKRGVPRAKPLSEADRAWIRARYAVGITQAQLATQFNVSRATISRCLHGRAGTRPPIKRGRTPKRERPRV